MQEHAVDAIGFGARGYGSKRRWVLRGS